ncbi:MAG: hypothetical protein GXO93_04825 [FCB group bacterium]|nr:hypothetical protein [FCB group bacterium]
MKILTIILIISLLGNIVGLLVLYKYFQKAQHVKNLEAKLTAKQEVLDRVNELLPKRLVFIHHSVGQNWINDGGLKDSLMELGISVQSATYGYDIGEKTDINDWLPKFENNLDKIFKFDNLAPHNQNDTLENEIIMFKSCFPNSDIISEGGKNGNPYDTTRTIANYEATFDSLKNIFSQHPRKLFIYVTAPPLVPLRTNPENAARARKFNNWMKTEFLKKYQEETKLDNFLVFDLFDVLADKNNVLKSEYRRNDRDSHPNAQASKAATKAFLKFLEAHRISGGYN